MPRFFNFEMFLLLAVTFLVVAFAYGIHLYVSDRRYKLPPGPTPLPFVGSLHLMAKEKKDFVSYHRLSRKYGPIMTFYMGQNRFIVLSTPEVIQEAIVKNGKVFDKRPVKFAPGFENMPFGVIMETGTKWQMNRRFSLRALRDFGMGKAAMVANIQEEVRHLIGACERNIGKPVDPSYTLTNAVSNVICSLVFGRRFEYSDTSFSKFLNLLNKIISTTVRSRLVRIFAPFIAKLYSPNQLVWMENLKKMVNGLLNEAIDDHRKDFSPENIRDFPDVYINAEKSGNPIEFDTFSNVMIDLFIAGTETTSTLLNWSLLYLSLHPEVQKRCQEQIDQVIGSDRLPDINDRPQLVYVDAVLNEILRVVSIAPRALFHANDEMASISGYEIPEQSVVIYNVWGVHHDPDYWKNPHEFNPDRWIGSDGKLLSHSTYFMPFGIGPRICLGELLAKSESFVFLTALLHRFNFRLDEGSKNVSLDAGHPGVTHTPPKYKLVIESRSC